MKNAAVRGIVFTIVYLVVVIGLSMMLYAFDIPYLKAELINENIGIVLCGMLLFGALEARRKERENIA